ncbi:hypothetical protein E4J66_09580 [Actinomyces viscosus]|uniref:Uncharacterized protein n=1 Tax=Actinomyces viscosus TaxID=1656 RepID=A0A448PHH4_ACTVI|nr:hypothetical protein [Actinomyces viscosus]TFH52038.1 hypothetical protein E4J66_09580 [Actinomyces viscosus]VEI14421.1 Uncharacterised protein [Actinomyces viscosus]
MSEISLSQALSRTFEDRVDLGSWAGFTPSLARFLDEVCRPEPKPATQRGEASHPVIDPSGATLLLTAPTPMVKEEELAQEGRWSRLLSRLALSAAPVPSPDLPGAVLVGRSDGIEVSLPELDAQGRVMLGPTERRILGAIGWQETGHVFSRLLPDGEETAELVTRILIEVLEVAHPADLDYLLRAHSDVS